MRRTPTPPTPGEIAFNKGCQARLEGYRLEDNEYDSTLCGAEHGSWRCGWIDVHKHWGADCKVKERMFQLPKLRPKVAA